MNMAADPCAGFRVGRFDAPPTRRGTDFRHLQHMADVARLGATVIEGQVAVYHVRNDIALAHGETADRVARDSVKDFEIVGMAVKAIAEYEVVVEYKSWLSK